MKGFRLAAACLVVVLAVEFVQVGVLLHVLVQLGLLLHQVRRLGRVHVGEELVQVRLGLALRALQRLEQPSTPPNEPLLRSRLACSLAACLPRSP